MNQQALSKGSGVYDTKDREIVIFLLVMELEILKLERDGRRMRFFFALDKAIPFINLWNSNKPIPVSDIRKFFAAERIFNSAVHDGIALPPLPGRTR